MILDGLDGYFRVRSKVQVSSIQQSSRVWDKQLHCQSDTLFVAKQFKGAIPSQRTFNKKLLSYCK